MYNNQPRRQTTPWQIALVLFTAFATLLAGVGPAGAALVQGACVSVYPSGPGVKVDPECKPVGTDPVALYHVQTTLALGASPSVGTLAEAPDALTGVAIHETKSILNETVWNGTIRNGSDSGPGAVAGAAAPDLGALAGESGTAPSSTVAPLLSAELPADRSDPLGAG